MTADDSAAPAAEISDTFPTRIARFFERSPGEFAIGRDLFLRLLGLVSFAAGISLAVQVQGLYGTDGILPFTEYLQWVEQVAAGDWGAKIVRAPTILWWFQTDGALVGCAWTAALAGLALTLGVAPRLTIPIIWLSYASIMGVGRVFLSFQWDALLLETLVVAWFLAPWSFIARPAPLGHQWAGHFATKFLLFKLMWLAGWVKVASGDPSWTGLGALEYHLWTQPLPTWTAYYAHALPGFVLAAATGVALAIELVAPWFLFAPRKPRLVAVGSLIALQVGIAATGNFGFFNLLTIALCLPFIDDDVWARIAVLRRLVPETSDGEGRPIRIWIARASVVVLVTASATGLLGRMAPATLDVVPHKLRLALQTTRSFNGYGLFAVMTKDRREISIELSADGVAWERVEFHYKPNAHDDRPVFAGLHMPRLDWQMWFAGLGSCDRNSWLIFTAREIIEQNPDVIALVESAPTAENLRYMRFPSAQYRFGEDDWWTSTDAGAYCPTLVYVDGGFRPADLN